MPHRCQPMAVKYWSRAGLLLTTRCNAACASCYLACRPGEGEDMSADSAVAWWAELAAASPHGCRVHLSGGEPFLDWPRLIEVCRRARREGLAGLEMVETNAFWASDEPVVRERLAELDQAGMGKLKISADPYHQQFVPIQRCRLLARLAEEVLGSRRVQVRWRDWLAEGFDTGDLAEPQRLEVFAAYVRRGRERLGGRAAARLARHLESKPAQAYADKPCADALLRSRHVHVDGAGRIMPGTCAGILLGQAGAARIEQAWRQLKQDYAQRPIVGPLAAAGPADLLNQARESGYVAGLYAGKCHLCWDLRRHFVRLGLHQQELGPRWMYEESVIPRPPEVQ